MTSPMPLEDDCWSSDALTLIARLAESATVFDAYSLERDHGLRPPPHANMWGGYFGAHTTRTWPPRLVSASPNVPADPVACAVYGADSPPTNG